MRAAELFEAASAGVLVDGDRTFLSFMTNRVVNDRDANVVLTREILEALHDSIGTVLRDLDQRARHSSVMF